MSVEADAHGRVRVALGPDPHSYANFNEVRTTKVAIVLHVDFETHRAYATTTLTLDVVGENGAKQALLDTSSGLRVLGAKDGAGNELKWAMAQSHPVLGVCLAVDLPENKKGDTLTLVVETITHPNARGLGWLTPEQTHGKKQPFMYSQFQAILSRTVFPVQDTPSVKAPLDITIHVPPGGLVAAAGGIPQGHSDSTLTVKTVNENDEVGQEERTTVAYAFKQPIKIPSYLISFGIGALTLHKLGERSNVWCEAEIAEAAVKEFGGTDEYLAAALACVGEREIDGQKVGIGYVWNTYDLLLLPSSFPYGGMENPNLTFINQSLICGDRSLTDVIAHEITHSWAGNLVTNSTWSDFFLNEGTTMYVERLILEHLHGADCFDFESHLGYGVLKRTQKELQDEDPDWRKLRPSILGVDPDDSFSRIPYEKGYLFWLYVESLLPRKREDMKKWLTTYFGDFHGTSVSVEDTRGHLEKMFPEVVGKIDWEEWLYSTELPTFFEPKNVCGDVWSKPVEELNQKWATGDYTPEGNDIEKFQPAQVMLFLDNLINLGDDKITPAALHQMDAAYHISQSRNVEVLVRWILVGLHNKDTSILPFTFDFVSKHGRGVYVRPTYNELIRLAKDESFAGLDLERLRAVWKGNRPFYHNTIRGMFDKELNQ